MESLISLRKSKLVRFHKIARQIGMEVIGYYRCYSRLLIGVRVANPSAYHGNTGPFDQPSSCRRFVDFRTNQLAGSGPRGANLLRGNSGVVANSGRKVTHEGVDDTQLSCLLKPRYY